MAAPPLHVSDYIVLGLLSALGIAAGLYISFSRRRNRHGVAPVPSDGARDVEQEEAFLGSRRLYAIPLSVSLFASALTSTSLVSFPAHYYAYGMHAIWCLVSIAVVTPIVAHTFVPVLYNLHLTSVFEYLRMRYSNGVGVTACVIYFLLSEVSGGLGIYCCALALSTMLGAPFMVWNMVIGIVGTTYTVLECDTFTRNSGEREQNELQWRTVKGKLSTKQGHKGQRAAPEIQFKRREKRKCSHQHEKPHSAMCAAGHRWSRLQQSIGPRMHVLLGQSSTGSTTPCVAGVVIHPGPWPPTAARCRTEPGCLQANSLVWNLWYTESAGPSPVLVSSPASESSGSAIGLHPNLVPCLSTSS